MKKSNSFWSILVRKGVSPAAGELRGLPVSAPVQVYRDRMGIPHIFAEDTRDLFIAQGFVHAQDRLWQMETLRRFASGTLAEIAGDEAADLDHFSRLAGFANLQKRALALLSEEDRALFQAYVDGVNAYLTLAGKNLPLEFQSLKLVPRPYTIDDLGGTIPANAWFLQTNYLEEIIAVLNRSHLTEQMWNELFASSPGEKLPDEDFFRRFRTANIAPFVPAALAFYPALAQMSGGSNSWVVARGENGLPLLANDPHLDTSTPQVWYFCHLHCPTLNVAGSSMPGLPGIVIGRNEHVAWSMTNVQTDCCDLYVVRVDPQKPTRYFIDGKSIEMEQEHATINILGGAPREVTLYRTVHGAVITEVKPEIEAVVALKWYGTLGDKEMADTTLQSLFAMCRAESAEQFRAEARSIASVGQNLVYADDRGNIGWFATGRIPRRRGYSGRLPADGSSGACGWDGFLPSGEHPQSFNPPEGRIVTANHKTTGAGDPLPVSFSWACPYRYERIVELLAKNDRPSLEDFQAMQMDLYSKRAERLLPAVLQYDFADPDAREAAALLRSWGHIMDAGSSAAAVFQVFLVEFCECLLGDILGATLPAYLSLFTFLYSAPDRLLDTRAGGLPQVSHLLGDRQLKEVCEQALRRTMDYLTKALGRNRKRWRWGDLHAHMYRHPGAKGWLGSWLLNRGPYPASGCPNTVNPANFNPARKGSPRWRYEVTTIPSLRMVTSLSDPDRTVIMGPMGQSGQPGFPHYADMIRPWISGKAVPLPLTRRGAEAIAVGLTTFLPK
jgi:penicillin amidase